MMRMMILNIIYFYGVDCHMRYPIHFIIQSPFSVRIDVLDNEESMHLLQQQQQLQSSSSSSLPASNHQYYSKLGIVVKGLVVHHHPGVVIHKVRLHQQGEKDFDRFTIAEEQKEENTMLSRFENENDDVLCWQKVIQTSTMEINHQLAEQWLIEMRFDDKEIGLVQSLSLSIDYSLYVSPPPPPSLPSSLLIRITLHLVIRTITYTCSLFLRSRLLLFQSFSNFILLHTLSKDNLLLFLFISSILPILSKPLRFIFIVIRRNG